MPSHRTEAGVAELGQNKIWLAGGKISSTFLRTSIVYENGEWTEGADLPEGLEEHCMARIDQDTVILAGGENSPSYAANVYLFDIPSETWTEIDRMPQGARYDHSCGTAE